MITLGVLRELQPAGAAFVQDDSIHVYPLHGRAHVTDGWPWLQCWCQPQFEFDACGVIVKHNAEQ